MPDKILSLDKILVVLNERGVLQIIPRVLSVKSEHNQDWSMYFVV